MTEPGGEIGAVRRLPGVAPERVHALVDALTEIERRCGAFAERLDAGSVHEHAFGKLVDAGKVRDAYLDRLPKAKENLAEAAAVAREFLAEFAAPAEPEPEALPAEPETAVSWAEPEPVASPSEPETAASRPEPEPAASPAEAAALFAAVPSPREAQE